jgi:ElaA protein
MIRRHGRDKEEGIAQIGRVVTLCHGRGLGGGILHRGVQIAEQEFGARRIYLEAQQYAIGYYEKEGFEVTSEPFLEDGIPHVTMEKKL